MGGFVVGLLGADTGGGHKPQRAENPATLITQDIAKHVFHDHDIKAGGIKAQVRGGRVHQDMVDRDLGIIAMDFIEDLVPEHAGFQHVALVNIGK